MSTKVTPSFFVIPDEKKSYESSLQLGNVIYELAYPDLALLQIDQLATPLALDHTSSSKTLKNYRIGKKDAVSSKYGLFAKILDVLGLGVNISHAKGSEDSESYEIKSMSIESFIPSPKFLEGLRSQNRIRDQLQEGTPPSAFLVTGVVIASGVVFKSAKVHERENEGSVGVNASGVSLGPSAKRSKKRELEIDWEIDEPTILAFKVQKLQYKEDKLTAEDYVDGAYFGDESEEVKREVDFDAELNRLDVDGMETETIQDEFTGDTYQLYYSED